MKDTRDLRDPSKFPDLSALYAKTGPHYEIPFHEFVDHYINLETVPNYPKHESMQTEQTKRYQAELHARAKAGDIYATSLLKGETWDEPTD